METESLTLGQIMCLEPQVMPISPDELRDLLDKLNAYQEWLRDLTELSPFDMYVWLKVIHYIPHLEAEMSKKWFANTPDGSIYKGFKIRVDDAFMVAEMLGTELELGERLPSSLMMVFSRTVEIIKKYPNVGTFLGNALEKEIAKSEPIPVKIPERININQFV
jgi:hypothetical protein